MTKSDQISMTKQDVALCVWGSLYNVANCSLSCATFAMCLKSETPFVREKNEVQNTCPEAIDLDQSCSEQAHANTPGTGSGN